MNFPETISVDGKDFAVEYQPAKGRSSSVRLKNGAVVIRLTKNIPIRRRESLVSDFLQWAEKKIASIDFSATLLPNYLDGEPIVTHNKVYELTVYKSLSGRNSSKINGGVIELYLVDPSDADLVKELVEKLIVKDQTEYLVEVLAELNQLHFQEKYNQVRFKRIGSRFGSCSSTRNITIAYRLLFAPREVFRYVCVHELAHLREFNHSAKFWALVAGAMPEYKLQERWLKKNGFMLG